MDAFRSTHLTGIYRTTRRYNLSLSFSLFRLSFVRICAIRSCHNSNVNAIDASDDLMTDHFCQMQTIPNQRRASKIEFQSDAWWHSPTKTNTKRTDRSTSDWPTHHAWRVSWNLNCFPLYARDLRLQRATHKIHFHRTGYCYSFVRTYECISNAWTLNIKGPDAQLTSDEKWIRMRVCVYCRLYVSHSRHNKPDDNIYTTRRYKWEPSLGHVKLNWNPIIYRFEIEKEDEGKAETKIWDTKSHRLQASAQLNDTSDTCSMRIESRMWTKKIIKINSKLAADKIWLLVLPYTLILDKLTRPHPSLRIRIGMLCSDFVGLGCGTHTVTRSWYCIGLT